MNHSSSSDVGQPARSLSQQTGRRICTTQETGSNAGSLCEMVQIRQRAQTRKYCDATTVPDHVYTYIGYVSMHE